MARAWPQRERRRSPKAGQAAEELEQRTVYRLLVWSRASQAPRMKSTRSQDQVYCRRCNNLNVGINALEVRVQNLPARHRKRHHALLLLRGRVPGEPRVAGLDHHRVPPGLARGLGDPEHRQHLAVLGHVGLHRQRRLAGDGRALGAAPRRARTGWARVEVRHQAPRADLHVRGPGRQPRRLRPVAPLPGHPGAAVGPLTQMRTCTSSSSVWCGSARSSERTASTRISTGFPDGENSSGCPGAACQLASVVSSALRDVLGVAVRLVLDPRVARAQHRVVAGVVDAQRVADRACSGLGTPGRTHTCQLLRPEKYHAGLGVRSGRRSSPTACTSSGRRRGRA